MNGNGPGPVKPNWCNRTLCHGDNLVFMRSMNSGTVHLIATDPSFNEDRTSELDLLGGVLMALSTGTLLTEYTRTQPPEPKEREQVTKRNTIGRFRTHPDSPDGGSRRNLASGGAPRARRVEAAQDPLGTTPECRRELQLGLKRDGWNERWVRTGPPKSAASTRPRPSPSVWGRRRSRG